MLFTFLLVSGAAEKERLALGGEPGRLRRGAGEDLPSCTGTRPSLVRQGAVETGLSSCRAQRLRSMQRAEGIRLAEDRPGASDASAFSVHTVLAAIAHIASAERSRMPSFQHRLDLHITN